MEITTIPTNCQLMTDDCDVLDMLAAREAATATVTNVETGEVTTGRIIHGQDALDAIDAVIGEDEDEGAAIVAQVKRGDDTSFDDDTLGKLSRAQLREIETEAKAKLDHCSAYWLSSLAADWRRVHGVALRTRPSFGRRGAYYHDRIMAQQSEYVPTDAC